ncbi:hypothetical protein [Gimesia panareensis]|uniref:Cbb3-type cytochrome oxidase component FixQ n=1 Tax=Gimesia panareensis TaxID=2527978 RepID=A0A517Q4R4_9PLAN|nr:hypothetical protein [Gimesia panareensis]QDT26599.1 hypothetical protein Enr10x_19030 [Gimesia panareensis]QDU50522.1 hypothetical protein Pan110_28740 [Gimesia panareensis]QDV16209.1 hypothetical protein Pan153_08300 [Gimesia panareensis]
MIKEVMRLLNYDFCAEIALVLFLFAFGLVAIRTTLTSKAEIKHQSEIPLSDD